jgi:hypothetical protein
MPAVWQGDQRQGAPVRKDRASLTHYQQTGIRRHRDLISWDAFTEAQKLAQPEDFDFLHRIGESYNTLRRYVPEFLNVLKLRAAPAAKDVLNVIDVGRAMNTDNARKVPADAPSAFVKERCGKLSSPTRERTGAATSCALSELKNALRSGDIWVQGYCRFLLTTNRSISSAIT